VKNAIEMKETLLCTLLEIFATCPT